MSDPQLISPDDLSRIWREGVVGHQRALRRHIEAQDAEIAKLQAFKDYVHQRLDDGGVPADPGGPHSEHGCRVGDRLDHVFDALHETTNALAAKDAEIERLTRERDEAEAKERERCARLCDRNAEAWAFEAAAARERGADPLIFEAQHHEAKGLAWVIRRDRGGKP